MLYLLVLRGNKSKCTPSPPSSLEMPHIPYFGILNQYIDLLYVLCMLIFLIQILVEIMFHITSQFAFMNNTS